MTKIYSEEEWNAHDWVVCPTCRNGLPPDPDDPNQGPCPKCNDDGFVINSFNPLNRLVRVPCRYVRWGGASKQREVRPTDVVAAHNAQTEDMADHLITVGKGMDLISERDEALAELAAREAFDVKRPMPDYTPVYNANRVTLWRRCPDCGCEGAHDSYTNRAGESAGTRCA